MSKVDIKRPFGDLVKTNRLFKEFPTISMYEFVKIPLPIVFYIGFVSLLTVFAGSTSQATKSTYKQPSQQSSSAIRLRLCNQFHARSR